MSVGCSLELTMPLAFHPQRRSKRYTAVIKCSEHGRKTISNFGDNLYPNTQPCSSTRKLRILMNSTATDTDELSYLQVTDFCLRKTMFDFHFSDRKI